MQLWLRTLGAPETLGVLFYATVPVHPTVLDYTADSLAIALHCTTPLPPLPSRDAATTAVRYVDRSDYHQINGHTVDGVCDSFLTPDFCQDEYDLSTGYNGVFYAMNDLDVDEHALLRRILSALKKDDCGGVGGGGGSGSGSGSGSGGRGGGGGGGSAGGGRFITDYCMSC